MAEILQAVITGSNASLLTSLNLDHNLLTRVPDEIRLFPQLKLLSLGGNMISTIHTGALNFNSAPIHSLFLDGNQIGNIEPGAIRGIMKTNMKQL